MAERRMFAKTIILSDEFLDMPTSARCLYFTLGMVADDDGFVNNPKSIMRQSGASLDDMNILIAKKFILNFDDGVIVIKHWLIHNYIQPDRYKPTKYMEDKDLLYLDENKAYTTNVESAKYTNDRQCIQNVYKVDTQDRIGKDSIELEKEKEKIYKKEKKEKFTPPLLEEVRKYAISRGREDIAQRFYDYFTAGNWEDSKGQKVKNWKQKFITWENHNTYLPQQKPKALVMSDYEYLLNADFSKEYLDGLSAEQLHEKRTKYEKLMGE